MSRKSKTRQLASAQSLASNFTTDWVNIPFLDNVGIAINTASVTDNTGTFAVEVRMKDGNDTSDPIELTLSSTPTLADADDDFFINLNQVPATQVRLKFTAAGGTPDGTAQIWFHTTTIGS